MKPLIAIALTVIALAPIWPPDYRVEANPHNGVASAMEAAALKYHGIKWATIDEFGFGFFWRDGHRCRLYSRGFLEKFRRESFYGRAKKFN